MFADVLWILQLCFTQYKYKRTDVSFINNLVINSYLLLVMNPLPSVFSENDKILDVNKIESIC